MKSLRAVKNLLLAPVRAVRALRYDPDPYGQGATPKSAEQTMLHGQVNQNLSSMGNNAY
jgi:hypothetical protein